jgi:nickel-dependent lactate racemase
MEAYIYYEGKKVGFEVPAGWNLLYGKEITPAKVCSNPVEEVKRSLDHPIGSERIEELAACASRAVIIFDDLTRPTPTHLAFPEVLNRLNQGGIPDHRIAALCATGTHQSPDEAGLRHKLGSEAYRRLYPRVYNHDAESKENVLVGRTSRGMPVEINPLVAETDLTIGIGACFPHNWAGFGGGSKIVMPGVCGVQSIALHHLTWIRNIHTKTGITQGNLFYEECNEIARMIGFKYKIDFLLNFKGEVVKVFSGDVVAEHAEASKECIRIIAVDIPHKADVTISAAYPLELGNQSIKALTAAASVTKFGGQIIWVAPQRDRDQLLPLVHEVSLDKTANEYHRQLLEGKYPEALKPMGLSFMCTVLEIKRYRDRFARIVHVTDGLDRSTVESMKMTHAETVSEACEIVKNDLVKADVVILPYGGVVMPRVGSS